MCFINKEKDLQKKDELWFEKKTFDSLGDTLTNASVNNLGGGGLLKESLLLNFLI